MIPLSTARDYVKIEISKEASEYRSKIWSSIIEAARNMDGTVSRNGHRIYIPYNVVVSGVDADILGVTQSDTEWTDFRKYICREVETILEKLGKAVYKIDYVSGIAKVHAGKGRVKDLKIGKLISKSQSICQTPINILDMYSNDPIRLRKSVTNLSKSGNLSVVISDHPYDIAGMSTGRDWTSCMKVPDGANCEYVEADIKYGTLVAYLIESSDTNIQNPFARLLIKPYKLCRHGHKGNDRCPVVYYPERTVYSAYVGLEYMKEWMIDLMESIQLGRGGLKQIKQLYTDTAHAVGESKREFIGIVDE